MRENEELVDALTKSQVFQDYEKAFTETTGMPITLRPVETWRLPLHGKRGENPFCALIAGHSRACAACLRTQEQLARAGENEPATITCQYGLSETVAPVKLGAQTVAYLQTGQVMRQKPSETSFRRAMHQAESFGVNLDPVAARESFMKTQTIPQAKQDSVANLLRIFADHLSMKSNQIAVQLNNQEPPIITRARQYIADHFSEDLSLGQVAQAVHTSTFYFCKLFKKVTGINFTEYVSRLRIEKAKNLLLNPQLRVSEIAYESGFQSLTHFNRVFKKVAGESPTAFRSRLPGCS